MPAHVSPERLQFPLRPSRGLRLVNGAVHGVVLVLLAGTLLALRTGSSAVTDLSGLGLSGLGVAVAMALLGLMIGGHGWWLDRQLALRASNAIRLLQHDASGWSVGADESSLTAIVLTSGTTVTAMLTVLAWRDAAGRRGHAVLTPAMLDQDGYRKLCRRLWQHEQTLTDHVQPL